MKAFGSWDYETTAYLAQNPGSTVLENIFSGQQRNIKCEN